jgi:hypothetical protein
LNKRLKKKINKNNISGEISALRDTRYPFISLNNFGYTYSLDSSHVNYKLARQIYKNTHDKYKLGAGFIKPIINSIVGFMGIPYFNSNVEMDKQELAKIEESIDNPDIDSLDFQDDDKKQNLLDDHLNNNKSIFNLIHKSVLIDGDAYIYITKKNVSNNPLYNKDEFIIDIKLLDSNNVFCVMDDFDKNKIIKLIIRTKIQYQNENNNNVSYTIVETWEENKHSITYQDVQNKEGLINVIENNPYGFIPVIKVSNESDFSLNGNSEIEPVEPYIRAYHDVMLDNLKSNRMTAQPKLKIKVSDIETFLKNNFTETEISQKKLTLTNKNVVFLGSEKDDAGYIEVTGTTHHSLLEFLFMCIVDVSETPEFIFGTAISSSKASASEQMIPFLKKIERKRSMMSNCYDLMARMIIAINNLYVGSNYGKIEDFKTTIEWKEVDREDDKTRAETINIIIGACIQAIDNNLMSIDTAIDFISKYIDGMDTAEKEKLKIKKDNENSDSENDNSDIINEVINKLNNTSSGEEGSSSNINNPNNVIDLQTGDNI